MDIYNLHGVLTEVSQSEHESSHLERPCRWIWCGRGIRQLDDVITFPLLSERTAPASRCSLLAEAWCEFPWEPWRRNRLLDDLAWSIVVILVLLSDLMIVLVEIEQRVQLRLTRDQVLDPRFMPEGFAGLDLIMPAEFQAVYYEAETIGTSP